MIPQPADRPTLPAWPWLGEAFGKRRSATLELCRRATTGEPDVLPVKVFRVGHSYRVVTAELRGVLGLPIDSETALEVVSNAASTSTAGGVNPTPPLDHAMTPSHEHDGAARKITIPRAGDDRVRVLAELRAAILADVLGTAVEFVHLWHRAGQVPDVTDDDETGVTVMELAVSDAVLGWEALLAEVLVDAESMLQQAASSRAP